MTNKKKWENVDWFNSLWARGMGMREITQEEYDNELKEHPNLWCQYNIQQKICEKYKKNDK